LWLSVLFGTSDEHAIAGFICDLGCLADKRGCDFLDEVKRGIGHCAPSVMFLNRDYRDFRLLRA
jgi:hypothetical protein